MRQSRGTTGLRFMVAIGSENRGIAVLSTHERVAAVGPFVAAGAGGERQLKTGPAFF